MGLKTGVFKGEPEGWEQYWESGNLGIGGSSSAPLKPSEAAYRHLAADSVGIVRAGGYLLATHRPAHCCYITWVYYQLTAGGLYAGWSNIGFHATNTTLLPISRCLGLLTCQFFNSIPPF